jgi:hypothetical protein
MKTKGKFKIKDVLTVIEGWYKTSVTLDEKVRRSEKQEGHLSKVLEKANKQRALDCLFKDYIKAKYPEVYKEYIIFIKKELPLKRTIEVNVSEVSKLSTAIRKGEK